jgi:hypothetical protein
MVEGNLNTTNVLLGIMAAVSVLEALLLVAVGVMAYKAYAAAMQAIRDIEERQIAPLTARAHALMGTVDGVLADVRGITSKVGAQTDRVDAAIRSTIDRVDETADRVRTTVSSRVDRVLGMVHGLRSAVEGLFGNGQGRHTGTPRPA